MNSEGSKNKLLISVGPRCRDPTHLDWLVGVQVGMLVGVVEVVAWVVEVVAGTKVEEGVGTPSIRRIDGTPDIIHAFICIFVPHTEIIIIKENRAILDVLTKKGEQMH